MSEAKRLADFDVLCLQEVADNFPELKGAPAGNQFAALAELLPGYAAVEGVALDIPGRGRERKRFGNMILSRYPVEQVLRYTLPWEADATHNMPRLLIEAVAEAPFGPLRVMTTHLEIHRSACAARRSKASARRTAPPASAPRGRASPAAALTS